MHAIADRVALIAQYLPMAVWADCVNIFSE